MIKFNLPPQKKKYRNQERNKYIWKIESEYILPITKLYKLLFLSFYEFVFFEILKKKNKKNFTKRDRYEQNIDANVDLQQEICCTSVCIYIQ